VGPFSGLQLHAVKDGSGGKVPESNTGVYSCSDHDLLNGTPIVEVECLLAGTLCLAEEQDFSVLVERRLLREGDMFRVRE